MKTKIILTFLVILTSLQVSFAQTGDWVAGDETVAPSNPLPSLGTCTLSGSFTWLSFDVYDNANHLAVLSYALPPCVDASTGTPTLTYLNNTAVAGVTFAQVGQGYQATLPPTITFPAGEKLVFTIANLQVYDNQNYAGQQATHSISYVVAPASDQTPNNSATITFGTQAGAAPLPVELLSFDATLIENTGDAKVRLDWSTSSEKNSDYFEIQRSVDGVEWEDIGEKVTAAGNSTTERNYTSYDDNPLLGVSFYRLKQVDFNKNSFLSEARKIVYTNGDGSVKLFPNPTQDNLNVEVMISDKALIEVKVLAIDGRVVQSAMAWGEKGSNTLNMDLGSLANGVYEVNIYNNNTIMYTGKVQKK